MEWDTPDSLLAAVRPGDRVLLRDRFVDALAGDPASVTVAVETREERAWADLHMLAIYALDPPNVIRLLVDGCNPAVADILIASLPKESAQYWRRRRYAFWDLHQHGRAGWLRWALGWVRDVVARDGWEVARWKVGAALALLTVVPFPAGRIFGRGRQRLLGGRLGWHKYCMQRAEAMFTTPLEPNGFLDTRVLMARLRVGRVRLSPLPFEAHLGRPNGFDLVVVGGMCDEVDDTAGLAHALATTVPKGGRVLAWSVLSVPSEWINIMKVAGFSSACVPVRPDVFASHWMFTKT